MYNTKASQVTAIGQIERAIVFLAGRCDGASTIDGQGFNGFDSAIGHDFAASISAGFALSRREARSALKMLGKYRGQLELAAIVLPSLDELEATFNKLPTEKPVKKSNVIAFPVLAALESKANAESDREFRNHLRENSPYREGLSEQQQQAFDLAHEWFFDGGNEPFVLTGFAGTGKSFTVQRIVHSIRKIWTDCNPDLARRKSLRVALVSPTHKATKVLADFAAKADLSNVHINTLHSILHVMPGDYDEHGRQHLAPNKYPSAPFYNEFDLVVVDESSMIGQEMLDLILKLSTYKPTIFMGDRAQLSPVNPELDGEPKDSPIFDLKCAINLTQVMRYEGAIAVYATALRQDIRAEYPPRIKASGNLEKYDKDDWEIELLKSFKVAKGSGSLDSIRACAYSNKRMNGINDAVRKTLYPGVPDRFMPGERLIAKEPIFKVPTDEEWSALQESKGKNPNPDFKPVDREGRPKRVIVMNTCQECTITSVEYGNASVYSALTEESVFASVYRLNVTTDEGVDLQITATVELPNQVDGLKEMLGNMRTAITGYAPNIAEIKGKSPDAVQRMIKDAKKEGWKEYYSILEELNLVVKGANLLDRLQYSYALTIHQMQGSTYHTVFADFNSVYAARDFKSRNQLRYVAATRASDRMVILSRH